MTKFHASQSLKDRTFEAVQNRFSEKSPRKRPGRLLKPAVCTALALALVIGGVSYAGRTGLPLAPGGQTPGAAQSSGNFFTLVAFAGEPEGGVANFTVGDVDFPGRGGGKICDFGNRRIIRDYNLNLTCTGENITSLDYSIEGGAVFTQVPQAVLDGLAQLDMDAKEATATWDPATMDPYVYLPAYETFTQFTIQPGEDLSRYLIRCIAPISTEEEAILKDAKEHGWAGEGLAPTATIEEKKAGDMLSASTVTVTAHFADGSSQSRSYRFSTENYLENLQAYQEAARRLEEQYYGPLTVEASAEEWAAAEQAFFQALEEMEQQYPLIVGSEVS